MNKYFITWLTWILSCGCPGLPARGEVTVTCDRPVLASRQECRLRATLTECDGFTWRWRLLGPEVFGRPLTKLSDTEARFSAPLTQAGGTFTVVVEAEHNPSIRGECRVRVEPNPRLRPGPWDPGDALVAGSFRPSLLPFPGGAAPACKIAFCDGAFGDAPEALRRLDRCWIVAGPEGLRAFALDGEPVPLPLPAPAGACRAVAALPAGEGPCPPGAPRLVYGLDGEEGGRIFALGADGAPRELAVGASGGRPVRDLALDREGRVFVAFGGDRAVWRIGAGGAAALHARIPGPDDAGLLSLALDPAAGDLYAGDARGVWRVTPAGTVARVLKAGRRLRISACHLALRGGELLILDTGRQELRALHLESGRVAAVLGGASGPARFGPVRRFNPDLPAEQCAALGGCGPLALAGEDLCMLVLGETLATLDLPAGELAAPETTRSARQKSLEHFRKLQSEIRARKRRDREARRCEARERAEEAGFRAAIRQLERECPVRWSGGRPAGSRTGGLFCLSLLGLGVVCDPSLVGVLAQGAYWGGLPAFNMTALIDRYTTEALTGLDQQLGLPCQDGPVPGARPDPCAPAYREGVLAQIASIRAQMEHLFVDPPMLGAGSCLPGERRRRARQRLILAQSDTLAAYDGLSGDASALNYQLTRDGYALLAAGRGLQAGAAIAGRISAGLSGVLNNVGSSLDIGGAGLQSVAAIFGKIAGTAIRFKGQYQWWAGSRTEALLNCTGSPYVPPAPSGAPRFPAPDAPASAMEDALGRLETGCAMARRHLLSLPVCSPDSLSEFRARNGTASDMYRLGSACFSSGTLLSGQALCAQGPLGYAEPRSGTLAYFDQFYGEIVAAAYAAFGAGDGLLAGSQGLTLAGQDAMRAGNGTGGEALLAAAGELAVAGNALFADGEDLLRISALSRRWEADVTVEFNAEDRAALDRKEAARSSSTGAAASLPRSGTEVAAGAPPVSSSAAAPAWGSTAADDGGAASSGPLAQPPAGAPTGSTGSTSAAARARTVPVLDLVQWVLARPWRPWSAPPAEAISP